MKTLGIDINGARLSWIGIEGTREKGNMFFLSSKKLDLPESAESAIQNYIELKKLICTSVAGKGIERVGIVKSAPGCGIERVKCELIVELACQEMEISSYLIAPQTIAAAERPTGILKKIGQPFETLFNNGSAIDPAYLGKAAICAWCVFDK